MTDLVDLIQRLGHPTIVVVGDAMLDRYVFGSVSRISPEAPIPVLRTTRTEDRPGGAASAAANLRVLESEARLVGYVGDDVAGVQLRRALEDAGVDHRGLVTVEARETTVKTRMVAGGLSHRNRQQLVRIDQEDTGPFPAAAEDELRAAYDQVLEGADCVLISDYAKGALSESLTRHVIAAARAANIPVVVDPKGHDYSRYAGASVIKPNRSETEAATGIRPVDRPTIAEAGKYLLEFAGCEAAIISLDKDGMAVVDGKNPVQLFRTTPREVFDVTGAGDMVVAALALALGDGHSLLDAVQLANLASSVEVSKIGAIPVTRAEMLEELAQRLPIPGGILTLTELLRELVSARAGGERIVFTNGCFDVLHAGHARFVNAARAEGDLLVLGLNSDASVRRLKGSDRPVNPAADRAEVLASFASVDYVVVFEEDTPIELIKAIQPDVLVKGADWREKGVVGADLVEAAGGRVALIDLLEGRSTTNIVRRIRASGGDDPS
jgi:D-beta-D-heptose 7-phosphate kinase / D-beta-D-heptose 1-phosphate adenosyltransferase